MKKMFIIVSVLLISVNLFIIGCAEDGNLTAKIEEFTITLNEKEVVLNDPVVTINDKTYLPLRDLCKVLGIDIAWDEAEQKVAMTTSENSEVLSEDAPSSGAPWIYEEKLYARDLSLKDFAFLEKGMSLTEIHEKVGEPSFLMGSGVIREVYRLNDNSLLYLNDYGSSQLEAVSLQINGAGISIDFNDDGKIMIY